MGKQIAFFMDKNDESEFSKFVLTTGNVVFAPATADTPTLPEFLCSEEANNQKNSFGLVIWNKAITDHLCLRQYGPGIFAVDSANQSVIEFSRSFLHDKTLIAGRLWAEMNSFDKVNKQLVYKGSNFEKWYDSLARWIRRRYKRDPKYGISIGPSAHKAFEGCEIKIAQHLTVNGPI